MASKLLVVLLVLLLVVVLFAWFICAYRSPVTNGDDGTDEIRLVDKHEWLTIEVEARFEGGAIVFNEQASHDLGVSGPGDTVTWTLDCRECEEGTQWRVANFRQVADLSGLTDRVMDLALSTDKGLTAIVEETHPKLAAEMRDYLNSERMASTEASDRTDVEANLVRDLRQWLSIEGNSTEDARSLEGFLPPDGGWEKWYDTSDAIAIDSDRDGNDPRDTLWKYDIEIRLPEFDETQSCEQQPELCFRLDPHKYSHSGPPGG